MGHRGGRLRRVGPAVGLPGVVVGAGTRRGRWSGGRGRRAGGGDGAECIHGEEERVVPLPLLVAALLRLERLEQGGHGGSERGRGVRVRGLVESGSGVLSSV